MIKVVLSSPHLAKRGLDALSSGAGRLRLSGTGRLCAHYVARIGDMQRTRSSCRETEFRV